MKNILFHKTQNKYKKGLTLIEVIISLGVISIVLGAVFSLSRHILVASGDVKQDLVAANLAQEGIDLVRNLRDSNWFNCDLSGNCNIKDDSNCSVSNSWRTGLCSGNNYGVENGGSSLVAGGGSQLLRLQSDGTYSYGAGGQATPFRREIILSSVAGSNSAKEMRVNAVVRWCHTARQNCSALEEKSINAEDILYNWFPRFP